MSGACESERRQQSSTKPILDAGLQSTVWTSDKSFYASAVSQSASALETKDFKPTTSPLTQYSLPQGGKLADHTRAFTGHRQDSTSHRLPPAHRSQDGTSVSADRPGMQGRFVDFSRVVAAQGRVEGQGRAVPPGRPRERPWLACTSSRAQSEPEKEQPAQFSFLHATTPFLTRIPPTAVVNTTAVTARPAARPSSVDGAMRLPTGATAAVRSAAERRLAQLSIYIGFGIPYGRPNPFMIRTQTIP